MARVRHESSVTAVSWVPSDAIEGISEIPVDLAVTHDDEPPPDQFDDFEDLRTIHHLRQANDLRAFIEVEGGEIVDHGYLGRGHVGPATVRFGPAVIRFPALHMPDIRQKPVIGPTSARFLQTVGGRMAIPTPRSVGRKPDVQVWPSLAWTTLELVIDIDGAASHRLVGASPFPRHWIYDDQGLLAQKTGLVNFRTWSNRSFGDETPWGAVDSPAIVNEVESEIERQMTAAIMHGLAKPAIRTIEPGEMLTMEDENGPEAYLILDGIFLLEIDGFEIGEIGPGAVVGALDGGVRTATFRATAPGRVADASRDQLDPLEPEVVAENHGREAAPA
jgi:hypothetical protein